MKTSTYLLLLSSPLILAGINGRCSNGSQTGICIDRGRCVNQYGGRSDPGRPGAWSCPGTPDNIECCEIIPHCPNHGSSTYCTWDSQCRSNSGRVLGDPVCPGGNDYVCCDIGRTGGHPVAVRKIKG